MHGYIGLLMPFLSLCDVGQLDKFIIQTPITDETSSTERRDSNIEAERLDSYFTSSPNKRPWTGPLILYGLSFLIWRVGLI